MSLPDPIANLERPTTGPLVDRFGRQHTYVRVSVTDRCNYRCTYCMPAEGLTWLHRRDILSYEEIVRIVRAFAGMGVHRIRLTGGEPTVRRDLEQLVAAIAAIPGIDDLSMTTNGHVFAKKAEAFAAAGLRRVNISIDTVDPARFAALTRGGDLSRVLASIEAARAHGLTPIKLNCVVVAGENECDIEAMLEHFAPHADDTVVRFIEYMPWDATGKRRRHLPAQVIRERLAKRWTLEPASTHAGGGPAVLWTVRETGQTIGFVSPMTEHFCHTCNRLRVQADGHLRTCLSRDGTPSLRDLLRDGASDTALEQALRVMVWGKVAGHEAHLPGAFRAFEGAMTSVGG
ncbi:MAG: cyclic pyranopterin phosphate synthase [Myxococcota bacterium]